MEKNNTSDQGSINSSPLSKGDSSFGVLNASTITHEVRSIINLNKGEWVGLEGELIRVIHSGGHSSLINPRYYRVIGADSTQQELIKRVLKKINSPHTTQNKDTPKPIPTKTPKQIPTINTETQPTPTPTLNPSPSSKTPDEELKQLETLTSLCKTLNTYHERGDKMKTLKGVSNQDKLLLLTRTQTKQKTLIEKRLKELKKDPSFSITGIKAYYKGQYVQAVKTINLGCF